MNLFKGPLVYYANSKWYLYGIVSFVLTNSNGNCNSNRPSYYSQVPAYLTWLEEALAFTESGRVQLPSFAFKLKAYSKIELGLIYALIAYLSYRSRI